MERAVKKCPKWIFKTPRKLLNLMSDILTLLFKRPVPNYKNICAEILNSLICIYCQYVFCIYDDWKNLLLINYLIIIPGRIYCAEKSSHKHSMARGLLRQNK